MTPVPRSLVARRPSGFLAFAMSSLGWLSSGSSGSAGSYSGSSTSSYPGEALRKFILAVISGILRSIPSSAFEY